MLFWDLPVPISSACANIRFSSQCSISRPHTPLITNTLELFCTWTDYSPMWYCRQTPPDLRLSNCKCSPSLWEHAFGSFFTNHKIENNPAFIFILSLQGITKVSETLLILYTGKQRVQPLNLQNGACLFLGWATFIPAFSSVQHQSEQTSQHHVFSPVLAFSKLFGYWWSGPSCLEGQTWACLSACLLGSRVSMLFSERFFGKAERKILWKSWAHGASFWNKLSVMSKPKVLVFSGLIEHKCLDPKM